MIEKSYSWVDTQTDVSCFGTAHGIIADLKKFVNLVGIELEKLQMAQ